MTWDWHAMTWNSHAMTRDWHAMTSELARDDFELTREIAHPTRTIPDLTCELMSYDARRGWHHFLRCGRMCENGNNRYAPEGMTSFRRSDRRKWGRTVCR